jgi:hypothetical protein
MRFAFLLLLSGLLCLGCGRTRQSGVAKPAPTVTPSAARAGTVTSVNPSHRFVVVTFPFSQVPGIGQPLNVYRKGLKVGELKVTGPEIDTNTVADIIAGEAQVNDEVRIN